MPNKLRNSMKGLINIKNNDNKCFFWCDIRHLNPLKIHTERITKPDPDKKKWLMCNKTKDNNKKHFCGSIEFKIILNN